MTPEEYIDAVVLAVCENVAVDIVADIQAEIAALYPPASEPGTPPHKRSGALSAGVQAEAAQQGVLTQVLAQSTAPYSAYLEEGTDRMAARPFMAPMREKWAGILHDRLVQAFSDNKPSASPSGTIVPIESLAA